MSEHLISRREVLESQTPENLLLMREQAIGDMAGRRKFIAELEDVLAGRGVEIENTTYTVDQIREMATEVLDHGFNKVPQKYLAQFIAELAEQIHEGR